MSSIPSPCIILVRPQMGENIGASARAMYNFGLTDLRLVAPRDGWPNTQALDVSAGALDKMPDAQIFETLAEAAADLHHLYATTSRPREMVKPVLSPQDAAQEKPGQKIGFVFGPERTGLENDEIALCHSIIDIPTNPDFRSLNLAQSVLLVAYEWFCTHDKKQELKEELPAKHEDLHEFLDRLMDELGSANFFRSEGLKPTMIRNIKAMFARAELTDQEVRTLHGIVSALKGNKLN